MNSSVNFTDVLDCIRSNRTQIVQRNNYSNFILIVQIATAITAVLGLVGNMFSLIVLRMPQMKSSFSLLLTGLTVSDSVQLIVYLIYSGSPLVGIKKSSIDAIPNFSKGISMMAFTALTASSYFTVLLSFERYIAVCKPFKALSLFPTRRRMLNYVLVIVLVSILFNLPKWWEMVSCRDVNTRKIRISYDTTLRKYVLYKHLYVIWSNVLINFLVPFVILTVLNGFIYRGILEANKSKRVLSKGQIQDMSITFMLVIVVIVFCICNMFYTVTEIITYFCSPCYRTVFINIKNYLYTFNASVNFVIYCLCGSKFRSQVRKVLQSIRNGRKLNSIRYQGTRSSITTTACSNNL